MSAADPDLELEASTAARKPPASGARSGARRRRAVEELSAEDGDESNGASEAERRCRILCIEADAKCAAWLSKDFEKRGFEVLVARDALEGLSLLLRWRPDLVVSDASLPGVSAMDIWERLHQIAPNCTGVPFIFLTGLRKRESGAAGKAVADADFIAKAVKFETLLKSVEARLARVPKARVVSTADGALTDREIEALAWAARGMSRDQIAGIMGITLRTVVFHLKRAQTRLGAATFTQAVVKAAMLGLIKP